MGYRNPRPDYVEKLRSTHFTLNGDDLVIKERVRGIENKTFLYIFNLTKTCYVSNLKPVSSKTFIFDIRGGNHYNLILKDDGLVEVNKLD